MQKIRKFVGVNFSQNLENLILGPFSPKFSQNFAKILPKISVTSQFYDLCCRNFMQKAKKINASI